MSSSETGANRNKRMAVDQRRGPDDAAALASLDGRSRIREARAVGQAPLPALIEADAGVCHRVRRVWQLDAAQRQEAWAARLFSYQSTTIYILYLLIKICTFSNMLFYIMPSFI
jgi:hypothetical protein